MGFDGFFKPLGVRDFNYFFGTQQAVDWYLPLKPYTKLEYEWVLENVPLEGQRVIDAGCHQGNYAVILGQGSRLTCVDPFMGNISLTEHNLLINDLKAEMVWGAVAREQGRRKFEYRSNGRLSDAGAVEVEAYTLTDIDPHANVVKLDVEGAEFEILPDAIAQMKHCHTWIIEVHPQYGDPDEIATAFDGWELLWVNRDTLEVEPYNIGTSWKIQATLIARKHEVD
jgi:FkbM family methyltransferase